MHALFNIVDVRPELLRYILTCESTFIFEGDATHVKKRQKKLTGLLLAMSMVLMLLAGCGSSNTTNKAAPPEATKENTPTATTEATTEVKATGLEGKVVFWSMWSSTEPQAKVIESAVAEFKAANPEVEVDLKFTGRDILKLIKPALDGGEQIDIWEADPGSPAGIQGMKDYVMKLDDLLAEPSIGMEGKSVKDSMIPSLLSWIQSLSTKYGLEEGIYSIPQQPYAVLFFYNKEVYEKAGITKAPATWEEFLADAEKIKAAGSAPLTFDDAYRDLFIGSYLANAMGADWVSQLVQDKTGEMWNDPIILQFAKDMANLNAKGFFSNKIAGSKYPAAQQDLVLGGSAAYLNGTWLPNEVLATSGPDFKWGTFQFPDVPNGNGKGGKQGLIFGSQGMFINKSSKNAEAAFELIKHIVSKQIQEKMAKDALAIPATIDSEWPAMLAEAEAAFLNAKENMPWGGGIGDGGDFTLATIVPTFMELITGKLKPEEFGPKLSAEAKKFYTGK